MGLAMFDRSVLRGVIHDVAFVLPSYSHQFAVHLLSCYCCACRSWLFFSRFPPFSIEISGYRGFYPHILRFYFVSFMGPV